MNEVVKNTISRREIPSKRLHDTWQALKNKNILQLAHFLH